MYYAHACSRFDGMQDDREIYKDYYCTTQGSCGNEFFALLVGSDMITCSSVGY
jgi:hypothetical protein